jgi:curved DNA-binding protein CbpA
MRWRDINEGYQDRLAALSAMTPHERLGVPLDASPEEIKAAYIRLVKAYHPDSSDPFMIRHNQEVLKLINAAYEILRGRP